MNMSGVSDQNINGGSSEKCEALPSTEWKFHSVWSETGRHVKT
jgi:hypothetical protein